MRYLINDNGRPFDRGEIHSLRAGLDSLPDAERIQYRNDNAEAIFQHSYSKFLIVSGPGTGKSTLFKQRINYWLQGDSSASILALSFVRKLVADLQNDIRNSNLTDAQKRRVSVFTLHKFARSIVERNHGCLLIRFNPHFRIINEQWQTVIWNDVLLYVGQDNRDVYSWKNYEKQLHNSDFIESTEWSMVRTGYLSLCSFYNASGFSDLIIYAKNALEENASLNAVSYLIADEYQDFNTAEDLLIRQVARRVSGLLLVGDDDQVLYEKLKASKASLIRELYSNIDYANAMLPFCSRSSFHIAKTAEYFINRNLDEGSIEKIYLPLSLSSDNPKVQLIGCATSATAVDYIKYFIETNRVDIESRKCELASGAAKDPYLLILTPSRELRFYASNDAGKKLLGWVAEFQRETRAFSEDYYKILNYYSLANHPQNNFIFRKVLAYEQIPSEEIQRLLGTCLESSRSFYQLSSQTIESVLERCRKIKSIIVSSDGIDSIISSLLAEISISDKASLKRDIQNRAINETEIHNLEHEEEEQAELDELEVKQMSAVELLTIIGSKGLSADHVIIIGFDDVNMSWITRNAFYVAMTRARKSLHIITSLGSGGSRQPHDFVSDLPGSHVEYFSYTKSNHQKNRFASQSDFINYFQRLRYQRYSRRDSPPA